MSKMTPLIPLLLVIVSVSSCKDRGCDNVGETWCSENILKHCTHESDWMFPSTGSGNYVEEFDCSQSETLCMELEKGRAACVLSKQPCPEHATQVCIKNRIGDCSLTIPSYPIWFEEDEDFRDTSQDCNDTEYNPPLCVDMVTPYTQTAICAYSTDPCDNGEVRCMSDNSSSWFMCGNSAWTEQYDCPMDAGACIQISETEVKCE